MSRPFSSRRGNRPPSSFVRVNGKIRAREVRVVGGDGQQLGVMPLGDALTLARKVGVDLVEVASKANPPVCRLVDYGRYQYEQRKKEKENKKNQHGNKVKEVQLRPVTDPHDFETKLNHAIDFLCDDMKVKVILRFKGRENAHREYGFGAVQNFVKAIDPWGHPDSPAKDMGRSISVMISPHPKAKRAANPNEDTRAEREAEREQMDEIGDSEEAVEEKSSKKSKKQRIEVRDSENPGEDGFGQSPFDNLQV